jgi:hypothetical protein
MKALAHVLGCRRGSIQAGGMPLPAPDPTVLHPIAGQRRVVFLRPLVQSANVEVGE